MKKQESFVSKGNKQIQNGETLGAMQTVLNGLNYYQNKIIKAMSPYPVSDAALLSIALRNFADAVEEGNPECKSLIQDLSQRLKKPEFKIEEKFHKTKER